MYEQSKKIISLVLVTAFLLFSSSAFAGTNTNMGFSDVPKGHWADKAIDQLRLLKITEGVGNNEFGMGRTIKRSEFVAFLVKLMDWELMKSEKGSFVDNMDTTKWYYDDIETAAKYGTILRDQDRFRPDEPITREEMAIMIVRTLGYDSLAKQLTYLGSPFDDVSDNGGYITIAKDLGIITGVGNGLFKPHDTAKREEAAAMMMGMYEKINRPINELHAFYAIRSTDQAEMIQSLDSVGFGWSRLEYDLQKDQIVLNMERKNNNEYGVPSGFFQPLNLAQQNNVSPKLMVFARNDRIVNTETGMDISLVEYILTQPEIRKQVIKSIVEQVKATTKEDITVSFDGVVMDLENMKGETLKQSYNVFLAELKQELDKEGKQMYVAVHPKRRSGQAYYDGYDYKTIGEIADKVILMAHDYEAKALTDAEMERGYTFTPLSPMDEIYYALRAITDEDTGIEDLTKIWMQISFNSAQWKLKDGKVLNRYPFSPGYDMIRQRLLTDVEMNYSEMSQNPYVTFFDSKDETQNVLWYEDSRSVMAKIQLARMFGIEGISLWRLGNIPDWEETDSKKIYLDIWQQILTTVEKN